MSLYVSPEHHRIAAKCNCGREHESREPRWVAFDATTHRQLCRYCLRSHPLREEVKALIARLEALDVARKFNPAIAIGLNVEFGEKVCNRQVDDRWCQEPRYVGRYSIVVPPLPSGGVGTRWTLCARCLDEKYGSVAKLVRELNGHSPLEPLPSPALPTKRPEQVVAERRQRWHLSIATALAGHDLEGKKITSGVGAERVLSVFDAMIANALEGNRGA
jgi:hypothetical protein